MYIKPLSILHSTILSCSTPLSLAFLLSCSKYSPFSKMRTLNPLQRNVFADSSSACKTFCHLALSALESFCIYASCHDKLPLNNEPDTFPEKYSKEREVQLAAEREVQVAGLSLQGRLASNVHELPNFLP
ncbi:hypothetical protein M758_7G047200 [Ceratodon purpureus]|nr:hypothetical protein M758_7G047200 [Ceratodon purpureus]